MENGPTEGSGPVDPDPSPKVPNMVPGTTPVGLAIRQVGPRESRFRSGIGPARRFWGFWDVR